MTIRKGFTVYLGGNLNNREYNEVRKERDYIITKLRKVGIRVLDPLRNKSRDVDGKILTNFSIKELIDRDKRDLQIADLLVILTGDICSDGSWLEFGYMKYKLDKPVIIFAPTRKGNMSWSDYESVVYDNLNIMIDKIINYWSTE